MLIYGIINTCCVNTILKKICKFQPSMKPVRHGAPTAALKDEKQKRTETHAHGTHTSRETRERQRERARARNTQSCIGGRDG